VLVLCDHVGTMTVASYSGAVSNMIERRGTESYTRPSDPVYPGHGASIRRIEAQNHAGDGMRQSHRIAVELAVVLAFCSSALAQPLPDPTLRQVLATFTEANTMYARQEYARAAELYEAVIAADPTNASGISGQVYFFLANSYDNLWNANRRNDPANRRLLENAAANYQRAIEILQRSIPIEAKLSRLALEYLAHVYGSDKLNDPAKAEELILQMIQLDPTEISNYFLIAKLYEDAGEYAAAENALLNARGKRADAPIVYMQLAAFYNRQGAFDKTIAALIERADRDPANPEAYYTIATYYWDHAYRTFTLTGVEKREMVMKGLGSVERAIGLKPDYMEALVYKNLLLRLQANLETDPLKRDQLIREADDTRDYAQQLRRRPPQR
jgi:tetratricopeptide (TPR) repeat protein